MNTEEKALEYLKALLEQMENLKRRINDLEEKNTDIVNNIKTLSKFIIDDQ